MTLERGTIDPVNRVLIGDQGNSVGNLPPRGSPAGRCAVRGQIGVSRDQAALLWEPIAAEAGPGDLQLRIRIGWAVSGGVVLGYAAAARLWACGPPVFAGHLQLHL